MALGGDLLALSSLLQAPEEQEEQVLAPSFTPANIGPPKASTSEVPESLNRARLKHTQDPNDIWSSDEVRSASDTRGPETRPSPEYDIIYKQDVTSEDVFLGTSEKTPGSQDCTHMVVKVHFPGSSMEELTLEVTKNKLTAENAELCLDTFLPLPVDDVNGKAQWDNKTEMLQVTLPIIRDTW
ncbi:unnamed protein product [Chrysoparadoxa australica]